MHGYFAILQDASFGHFPGYTITDFALQACDLTGTPGLFGVGNVVVANTAVSQYLEPGWYWLLFVQCGTGTAATIRGVSTRFDSPPLYLAGTTPATGTTIGGIGYTAAVTQSSGVISNINPNPGNTGSWTQVQEGSVIVKPWLYTTSGRYSVFSG
jgi:hypothetical protein